ncbi:signal transduction histidine kinase [Rhizobium leguminosarum]|uniref:histidine kinase n=1 Tax=Rhizobium leguminosarum TaxID=384 RepID=A0A7Z0DWX6_RHILE|nr:signal transduction histidine kinase [Rhizobium leguminosarum]
MALIDYSAEPRTPLASLTKAISGIARARSIDEVIATIRASARALIGCEGITVIRREGDLCHYIEEDAIGPLWKGQKFPATACLSGWSMINRQTVIVPDIDKDDRIPHELYGGTFVRAVAMAPIRRYDPVGAIGAYWSKPYEPTQWEVETLEALAEAAATAVEHIGFAAPQELAKRAASVDRKACDYQSDIDAVSGIAAVPIMLDVALRMTGMGFAAIARVTETRWITCSSLDHVGFGLKPGDELPIESTLCNEIRDHRQVIVFDDAQTYDQYRDHHTPRIYGLRSYISMPIIRGDGSFWGTLCAIDPKPAKVDNPQVAGTFKLFAELIAHHLDAADRLRETEVSLQRERELSELREQFIAVLGHDLRNPLAALDAGTSRLLKEGWTARSPLVLNLMKASISRMTGLVDNIMDLARARLGGGISLDLNETDLVETLQVVADEIRSAHPHRDIRLHLELPQPALIDRLRIAQLFSNLVSNAVSHGAEDQPVEITGRQSEDGIEISVRNGGTPIPADDFQKLFLPFKRGDASRGGQGLGLGLYIALEIAKAHGGTIDVSSNNAGTCFTLRMPL